jgi:hypothetical protein
MINMQQSTVDEYTVIQQNSGLEWQHAVSGWRAADNAWKIANNEIGQLKSVVNNLQKHIDELKSNMIRMDVVSKSSRQIINCHGKRNYH